jgi:hypothetical protein
VQAALLQLSISLRHLRAQFVLGRQLVELGPAVRHNVFHVSHAGELLAILDFRKGRGSIAPTAHPAELEQAEWSRRPESAGEPAPGFLLSSPSQMAWIFASRTDRDILPPRYRQQKIYFRRAPRVPTRWLRDCHLKLLREIYVQPDTLEALVGRTGLSSDAAPRDLACLYVAGSVTTTPAKAPSSAGMELRALLGSDGVPSREDRTAPAILHR